MSNINEDYILDYIRQVTPKRSDILTEMEEYTEENYVPIIEPEITQFLKVLLQAHKPKNILELGTAIGYSAIVMCEALDGNCNITSIERRQDMIDLANDYIKKAKYEDNIHIIKGEAEQVLLDIDDRYDFIFIDAAKGHYMKFFNKSKELLNPGGIIVSDNVLFKGMVASDKLVVRRKRTIVNRMREYLDYINNLEGYTSAVIPIGDGIAITYREV